MAMATGAVHQALVAAGLRTLTGLAVEAGDCRDIHHAAILIGYGAGAVCPWLALETARAAGGAEPAQAEHKMLKAFDAGLAKVMSKMGISVVDSYRGAHLFDILGLHADVVARCFAGTPAPLSGIGFAELDHHLRQGWLLRCCPRDRPAGLWLGSLPQGGTGRAARLAAGQCEEPADHRRQHARGDRARGPRRRVRHFHPGPDCARAGRAARPACDSPAGRSA